MDIVYRCCFPQTDTSVLIFGLIRSLVRHSYFLSFHQAEIPMIVKLGPSLTLEHTLANAVKYLLIKSISCITNLEEGTGGPDPPLKNHKK